MEGETIQWPKDIKGVDKFQISSLYTCTIETDKAYKTNTICYFTGSVWVYSVVAKVETASNISRNFCDPMLYWYSVALLI
jgi:hypothetical protein